MIWLLPIIPNELDPLVIAAVLGEDDERQVIYHPKLIELAAHYGFRPRACSAAGVGAAE